MTAIVILDREGRPLATWGEEVFPAPHDIWIDAEDRVYIVKGGGVSLFTIEGHLITQWVVTGAPITDPTAPRPTAKATYMSARLDRRFAVQIQVD